MGDILEQLELSDFVTERMNKPIMALEKQEYFKNRKKLRDNLYEEIYEVINEINEEQGKKFEELMGQTDMLSSYCENTYYFIGIADGIKFFNAINKMC